jgi:hypothetical protein
MIVWHGPARLPSWRPAAAGRTSLAQRASRRHKLVSVRCLMIGHDDQLAREPYRLFLRCAECGRCTRGWTIGTTPPRVTAPVVSRAASRAARPRRAGAPPVG